MEEVIMISGNVLLVLPFDIQCYWKIYQQLFYKVAFCTTLDINSLSWLHLAWHRILSIQWKYFLIVKLLSGWLMWQSSFTLGTP